MIHLQFVGSRSPVVFLAFWCAKIWKVLPAKHPLLLQEACRMGEVSAAFCVKSAKCKAILYAIFIRSFRLLNRIWARPKLWKFSQYEISDMLGNHAGYTKYFNYQSVEDHPFHPPSFMMWLGATDSTSSQRAARRWVFQLQIQGPMLLGIYQSKEQRLPSILFLFLWGSTVIFFRRHSDKTCCCAPIFLRSEL